MDIQINEEERRIRQRRERLNEMKRQKEKQMMFRKRLKLAAPFAVVFLLILIAAGKIIFRGTPEEKNDTGLVNEETADMPANTPVSTPANASLEKASGISDFTRLTGEILTKDESDSSFSSISSVFSNSVKLNKEYTAHTTPETVQLGSTIEPEQELFSEYVVLIDLSDDSIVAQKNAFDRMIPASMTKILTVLVAAENLKSMDDLDDTIVMTPEITDYGFIHKCTTAGFEKGETVTVRDLFYGTVLPSGADAAVGLAVYTAGSQESFVEMMNQKLEELGLSDTAHMTNCVGVYEEDHYCTAVDMAMILEAALDNRLCREVLSEHIYTTSRTEQHPEGIELSNWFLRRIEDKDSGGEVAAGKTGFVDQSKNCAASYCVDEDGKAYVCVTAGANSYWRCIYDHAGLYKKF